MISSNSAQNYTIPSSVNVHAHDSIIIKCNLAYQFTCVTLKPIDPVFNLLKTHGILDNIIIVISLIKVDEIDSIWMALQFG